MRWKRRHHSKPGSRHCLIRLYRSILPTHGNKRTDTIETLSHALIEKLRMPEVVQSARWVAAQRVRESERTDRLFFDPLAPALSGDEGMAALTLSEKYNPRHEETADS